MSNFVWSTKSTPEELRPMLETLEFEYPISSHGRGLKLEFKRVKSNDTYSKISRVAGGVVIEYSTITAAARALGSAFANIDGEEKTTFKTLGIMLDVSRNQVMKVDHIKGWLRRLALSGCNLLMLYNENCYELDGEPFFGYMRGAYSLEEIQEIDAYAATLGVEVVGCIQTLAHMGQTLRWREVYNKIIDTREVMMVGAPETKKLIAKMLDFWQKALRSRRIHIGMDEAWDLGRGNLMNQKGYIDGFSLFNQHLALVNSMCEERGLKPMIWSDMYFRLSNPQHEYYDLTSEIPDAVRAKIPKNVQFCYWDYYNFKQEIYEKMIDRHTQLGFQPIMASGIWTWKSLWFNSVRTFATVRPCIKACLKKNVRELFFTMWGDDGAYCHYDSALSGIIWATDLAYGVPNVSITSARFEAICHANFAPQIEIGELQYIDSPAADPCTKQLNISTQSLIWDDPLLGIAFDNYRRVDKDFDLKLLDKCDDLLCRILPCQYENTAGDINHAVNMIRALVKKLELRSELEEAYFSNDIVRLREIAVSSVPATIAAMEEFDRGFREQWLNTAKPFGLERIQQRNAGVIARLRELAERIRELLAGDIDVIEELEAKLPDSAPTDDVSNYNRVCSGSGDSIWQ